MANLDVSLSVRQAQSGHAQTRLGLHWLVNALGALLVGGLYLIAWAASSPGSLGSKFSGHP